MRQSFLITLLVATALCAAATDVVSSTLSCRRFTTQDGLPQMQSEAVWQDAEGYIWIGTLSGFARYDGRSLQPYLQGRRENIVGFARSASGVAALGFVRWWTVDGNQAVESQYDPDRKWLYNNFNGVDLPDDVVLLEDRDETHRHLARLTVGGVEPLAGSDVMDRMDPDRKLFVDGSTVYVPTGQGLYAVADDGTSRLVADKPDVFSLARRGSTLLALAADGIYAVGDGRLTLLTACHFAAPDYGLTARQRRDGALYIADCNNIYLYDCNKVNTLASGFNVIRGIMVDRWDRLWAATYQGVYLFFDSEFVNHRLTDASDLVRALAADAQGRVVMGTLNGNVIAGGAVAAAGGYFSPGAARVRDTVYMVNGPDLVAVTGADGAPRAERVWSAGERLRFVTAAPDGRLLVGSRRWLMRYDPAIGTADTLTTAVYQPWCAAADAAGNVWVGGSRGLCRVSAATLATDTVVSGDHAIITTMDRDPGGNIYFATVDSVFVVRDGVVTHLAALQPAVAGHEVRSLHVSPRGFLVVAAIDRLVVTRVGADGLTVGEARTFDHTNGFTMLEPQNAMMAELPDGTVWLAGLEECTSFVPERLMALAAADTVITEPRPWWKHWALWLLAAMLLAVVCWRLARIYERRRTQSQMQRLQREARLKNLQINSVRLKAIPHFHSNVLAGIEYFLMNGDSEQAIHYLELYNDFANRTLDDIDKPARTVAEEVDYTRKYLELEKLRFDERLEYSITVDDAVDRQELLPTMAMYTYCQNAVKHGIGNRKEGGRVDVTVTRRGGTVTVSVTDNGVGRAAAAALGSGGGKHGLRILSEQIELYNQANTSHITQTVTDLTDADGHACGTRFEISVPDDYNFFDLQTS